MTTGWVNNWVMFDNTGTALKEIIRRTTNIEGAHALNPQDSATPSAGNKSSVARDLTLDILSAISVSGLNYNHIVVIETAVYLYRMLAQNGNINLGIGDIEIPVFDVVAEFLSEMCSRHMRIGLLLKAPWVFHLAMDKKYHIEYVRHDDGPISTEVEKYGNAFNHPIQIR